MMGYTLVRVVNAEWRPVGPCYPTMLFAKRAGNLLRDAERDITLGIYVHGIRGLMPCHYRQRDLRYKGPIPEPDHTIPINWALL